MKAVFLILLSFSVFIEAEAASSKWTAVQPTPALAPMLVAKVRVDSRSYALYRDLRTKECFLLHKNLKKPG